MKLSQPHLLNLKLDLPRAQKLTVKGMMAHKLASKFLKLPKIKK